MSLFPITRVVDPTNRQHFRYRDVFLAHKPPEASWYAFAVTLLSETEIEFTVHDLYDNIHGGIGKETLRFKATVPASLTRPDVIWKATLLAEKRRERELAQLEEVIVASYTDEILEQLKGASHEHQST